MAESESTDSRVLKKRLDGKSQSTNPIDIEDDLLSTNAVPTKVLEVVVKVRRII